MAGGQGADANLLLSHRHLMGSALDVTCSRDERDCSKRKVSVNEFDAQSFVNDFLLQRGETMVKRRPGLPTGQARRDIAAEARTRLIRSQLAAESAAFDEKSAKLRALRL